MKRYKKAYVEITNVCNFKCSFCAVSKRNKTVMTPSQFDTAIKKLLPYTDYIYPHILGEPLTHPQINEILDIAYGYGMQINLTTNAALLDVLTLESIKKLRKITFSLHALSDANNSTDKATVAKNVGRMIKDFPDLIKELRFWSGNPDALLVAKISEACGLDLSDKATCKNFHIHFGAGDKFDWPSEKSSGGAEFCYGLRDQIGVLSDGTVVPCCLDTDGKIALGNIFQEDLECILASEKAQRLIKGFDQGRAEFALCKGCDFLSWRRKIGRNG